MTRKKVAERTAVRPPLAFGRRRQTDHRALSIEGPAPRGSILLLGGSEYGAARAGAHRRGAFRLRPQKAEKIGAETSFSVDREAFAGRADFIDQMDFLTDGGHANAPIKQAEPVPHAW